MVTLLRIETSWPDNAYRPVVRAMGRVQLRRDPAGYVDGGYH